MVTSYIVTTLAENSDGGAGGHTHRACAHVRAHTYSGSHVHARTPAVAVRPAAAAAAAPPPSRLHALMPACAAMVYIVMAYIVMGYTVIHQPRSPLKIQLWHINRAWYPTPFDRRRGLRTHKAPLQHLNANPNGSKKSQRNQDPSGIELSKPRTLSAVSARDGLHRRVRCRRWSATRPFSHSVWWFARTSTVKKKVEGELESKAGKRERQPGSRAH